MQENDNQKISIIFMGPLRTILRKSEDFLALEDNRQTVADILRTLAVRYGSEFENLIFDGQSINPAIVVFVNGRALATEDDWNSKVTGGEVMRMALVSQAAGG